MLLGNNETSKSVRDYYKEIANTLIFSHGDVSVNELTSSTLQKMKNELHRLIIMKNGRRKVGWEGWLTLKMERRLRM